MYRLVQMTVMLRAASTSPVITHRMNWRDYEQGFDAMRTGNPARSSSTGAT
jgi:threonine 3-dehydrogenase